MSHAVALSQHFDANLVAVSVAIAILASYTALTIAGRVGASRDSARFAWLFGGGVAMGIGISAMHFIGMLAMGLGTPIGYDPLRTIASVVLAIVASTAALGIASGKTLTWRHLAGGGGTAGVAIAGMHYLGMTAMRGGFVADHDPVRVLISIAIAISAAAATLWLAFHGDDNPGFRGLALRALSAIAMGFAISGMHYTAMSAAHFSTGPDTRPQLEQVISGHSLAVLVTTVCTVVLTATILIALFDRRSRRLARELLESRERYRQVAQALPAIVWTASADGGVDYVNGRWFAFTGLTSEQTLGSGWMGAIHPEDRDDFRARWSRAVADGSVFEGEFRIKRQSDGEYRWHLGRAVAVLDADKAVAKWLGTLTDIHEQKRAEAILRDSAHALQTRVADSEAEAVTATGLYQLLAENATDMVSTHRPDGSFAYATPNWSEYTGIDAEHFLGGFPAGLGHPEDLALLMTNYRRGLKTDDLIMTVWRCRRAGGRYGWLETTTRPVRDPATQRVQTFVCTSRDITARRELEGELSFLHDVLLAASAAPDLDTALSVTLETLCRATGWSYGEVWLPTPNGSQIERRAWYAARSSIETSQFLEARSHTVRARDEGLAGRSWATGTVQWAQSIATDERVICADLAFAAGFTAAVAAPVATAGQVVAVLHFFMDAPHPEDERNIRLLTAAAAQLSAVMVRHRMQDDLLRSEQRFRAASDGALDAFFTLDAVRDERGAIIDFRYTDVNPRATTLLSRTREQIVGHRMTEVFPFTASSGHVPRFAQVVETRVPLEEELEVSAGQFNGWIQHQVVPLNDGVAVTSRDVSARRRTEAAVRESEAKYRQLVERAADAILIVSPDGVCVEANARACGLLGRAEGDVIGRSIRALFVSTTGATFAQIQELALGEAITVEDLAARADGVQVPVEISAGMLPGRRMQIIARDISGRKEVERLKNEFLSVVSHELRTPLTSIRGALGLLAGGKLLEAPDKSKRMLDLAVTNTDRLIRLINDILDTERIESGAIAMERTWCDGHEIARQVAEAIRPVGERAGVEIRVVGESTRVWADGDRLTQTLTNLAGNAIKFSPHDSVVELHVAVDGSAVRFDVRDRGRGIPADKLDTIFERFKQVDASDAREKGGTGLGLAISRSIVHQHGGKIWVDSTLGLGSTFSFTIPQLPAEVLAELPVRTAQRVLLVEDDVALASVIATTLESAGLAVDVMHCGLDAVAHFKASGADLVIVDQGLPDLDGLQVLETIRQEAGAQGVPAIVYTASDLDAAQRDRARDIGATVAVKSRTSPEALVEHVARLLSLISTRAVAA